MIIYLRLCVVESYIDSLSNHPKCPHVHLQTEYLVVIHRSNYVTLQQLLIQLSFVSVSQLVTSLLEAEILAPLVFF